MKKALKFLLALSSLLFFIAGCSAVTEQDPTNLPNESSSNQIKVVTSIFPMYEIVKEIAGDAAEVSLMVGANDDAHHYEPSAQAVANVNEADVFVYSSEVMEGWVDSLFSVVENNDLHIVELGNGLNLEIDDSHIVDDHEYTDDDTHGHDHDHNHEGLDPHFWLDLTEVNKQLPLIVEALSKADPKNTEIYEENADMFSEQLLSLDQEYMTAFSQAKERIFVVQHQAFGHLAKRYDLEQVAVGGLVTEVEVSPKELVEMIHFINEQDVSVIYYQSGQDSGVAETLSNETGTEIAVLYDLENVPVDIEVKEHVYLEIMRQNLVQLKKSIR